MDTYLLLLLLFLLVLAGLIFWIIKTIKLFRLKRTKPAVINTLILVLIVLFTCWELRIIPLSADLDFKNQTKDLTGREFWSWNEYRYDEIGIRGEGFTFEIYKLNEEMAKYFANPDVEFFEHFPSDKFGTTHWNKTPITDTEFVNYMTPIYGNWSKSLQKEIEYNQNIVKQVATNTGSYYAIRRSHGNDLYLISPKRKMIIYINHNM
jgi:uncharacterized membrane protein YcgQ (UPF0703/DUF1980 family)